MNKQPVTGCVIHPAFPHTCQLRFRLNKEAPTSKIKAPADIAA
jgi:hypothetical protein